MERLQNMWNYVVVVGTYGKITVRDIVMMTGGIAIVAILLVRCDSTRRIQTVADLKYVTTLEEVEYIEEREEIEIIKPLQDTCYLSASNLSTLETLLQRSDLCSEEWFRDCLVYRERLEQQNAVLQLLSTKEAKKQYRLQAELVKTIQAFYETQNDTTVEHLETAVKAYQGYARSQCKGEGVS